MHLTTLASAQAHPASHTGLPVTGEEPSSSVHAEEPLGSLGSAGKDSRVSGNLWHPYLGLWSFIGGPVVKNPPANAGDSG